MEYYGKYARIFKINLTQKDNVGGLIMKGQEKNKSYLTIGLIQLITIITFTATMYFMFTKESVILNPVPYTVGIGAVIIIIDFIILSSIFKKYNQKEMIQNV